MVDHLSRKMLKVWIVLGLIYGVCHGSRILVFYPGPSNSLLPGYSKLFLELSHRGHQLTVVTAYKLRGVDGQNIKQLLMDLPFSQVMENSSDQPFLSQIYNRWQTAFSNCEMLFNSPKFISFMNRNETYDLFIGSPFYFLECSIAVAHHLNLPVLNIYPNRLGVHSTHLMGQLFPSSYVTEYNLNFGQDMSLMQRCLNTIFCLSYSAGVTTYYLPHMNGIVKQHFPQLPPLQDMLKEIPVTLLDSNLAVDSAQPRLPGVVPIAGLTIPQIVTLPKEIEEWMNRSESGVILFEFSSSMTSQFAEVQNVILEVFGTLPQQILIKWEGDEMVGRPANVKLVKWIPQAAVFAHPKCQMVITHGDLHSWMEAVHYSVPLLGILPFFQDQLHNLNEMQERGHGLYFTGPWTQNHFHNAINEVLHNQKFRERLQQASKVFWDQPLNPLQTAVYWTEYVIRHKGAKHLLSSSSSLSWFQVALLDIAGVLIISIISLALLLRAGLRAFRRWLLDYEYIFFNRFLKICQKFKEFCNYD